MELPKKKYKIILADPPWAYENYSNLKDDTQRKACGRMLYNTMEVKEICELPISDITDESCVLFIWVTMPLLDKVFEIINAWGFKYKCCGFTWIKTTSKGIYSGLGHYTLGNAELCLIATKKKFPKRVYPVKQVIMSKLRGHSRKPDEVYTRIEKMYGDVSKIELFARTKRQGWDAWGNQVPTESQNILTEVSGNSYHN